MAPSGTITGTGPVGGSGVDLRRPVAKLSIWDGHRGCTEWGNPLRFDPGRPGAKPGSVTGTSFDMACDDGAGFDFYRVKFLEDRLNPYLKVLGAMPWSKPGAFGQFLITFMGAEVAYGSAYLEVCGYSGGIATCASSPREWGSENWANPQYYEDATIAEAAGLY
jgi:hypothetical protein